MPTIRYLVNGKKRDMVPVYVRMSVSNGIKFIVPSGLNVNPREWSDKTQTIKQRIKSADDTKLIKKLSELKKYLNDEVSIYPGPYSENWLTSTINRFHDVKDEDYKTFNGYIAKFIAEAEKGKKKNKSGMLLSPGTIRVLKGLQRVLKWYQGIEIPEDKKERPLRIHDFNDIDNKFYQDFLNFLTDEAYKPNTIGRFIKGTKYLMKKARTDKLHKNRDYEDFAGVSEETYSIALTPEEVSKIYNIDLSSQPRSELARDAFIILCETALRISDYRKIDVHIRQIKGKEFVDIYQQKTGGQVIIPLTVRFETIFKKYNEKLPRIPDQYINKLIKSIAFQCGLKEVIRWEGVKFGKRYERSAQKWELISCHTARRTAATNMYRAGMKPKEIRAITGHKTDNQLYDYIKISKEDMALQLSQHEYFNNLKIV